MKLYPDQRRSLYQSPPAGFQQPQTTCMTLPTAIHSTTHPLQVSFEIVCRTPQIAVKQQSWKIIVLMINDVFIQDVMILLLYLYI